MDAPLGTRTKTRGPLPTKVRINFGLSIWGIYRTLAIKWEVHLHMSAEVIIFDAWSKN